MNTYYSKTKLTTSAHGFTLIELMVVITIIAILGAVTFPGINGALRNAKINAAAQNGRQIALGLISYAQDFDGRFPSSDDEGETYSTSNEAFRELIPDYIDSERIFAVSSSAWGPRADGRIDDENDRLEAGENHFAYISGLTQTSRTDWPLIADGTNGSGNYTRTAGDQGGCWEGRKGIIITVSGSLSVTPMRGDDEERYLPRYGFPDDNALDTEAYMGDLAQLLDPE